MEAFCTCIQGLRRERLSVRTEQGCRAPRRTPSAEDWGTQEGREVESQSSCLVPGHQSLSLGGRSMSNLTKDMAGCRTNLGKIQSLVRRRH